MRLPSNEPCTSASSVELSPLKTPPSLIITFGQSANFASILPCTISRLQEVISPETDTPGPMMSVRRSASSVLGARCGPVSWCGGEVSPVSDGSVDFQTGSVGFNGKGLEAGSAIFGASFTGPFGKGAPDRSAGRG